MIEDMSGMHAHQRGFVVETVEERVDDFPRTDIPEPVQEVPFTVDDSEYVHPLPPKQWKPGELSSSLKQKVGRGVLSSSEQPRKETGLPSFLQEPERHAASPNTKMHSDGEVINFTSLATVVKDRFSNIQSVIMSIPAFLTVAVLLCTTSFFAGRFSASAGKQVAAQGAPDPTIQPVSSVTDSSPVTGTPDDIVKMARAEFLSVLEASKKLDQSTSEKEEISRSILRILDMLTKGISAYPDVAQLYFERAQIEKQVMESSPTLKVQAEADYQKTLEIAPFSSDYYVGFGDYYDMLGQNDKAIENYEKAVRLDPKNVDAMYALAKLSVSTGDNEKARTLYTAILSLLPSSSSQYAAIQKELDALAPAIPDASASAVPAASTSATMQ